MKDLQKSMGDTGLAKVIKNIYQYALYAAGVIILLAMVATVLLRYVFKKDLFGMEEIILCFVFWFYFFGGVNGSREDSQIKAEVLSTIFKNEKFNWVMRIVTRIIEIVVLIFLLVLSTQLFIQNVELWPTTQGLKIPFVIPQGAIVVGFLLMAVYNIGFLLHMLATPPGSNGDNEEGGAVA